jgi:uncharacterized protein
MKVAYNGLEKCARICTQAKDVDLDLVDLRGFTALQKAVLKNASKTVQILVDGGANINIINKDGETALDISVDNMFQEISEQLRRKGGKSEKLPYPQVGEILGN